VLERTHYFHEILNFFEIFPVVALLGPRQVGKTTLAKQFDSIAFFDSENPIDFNRLQNPMLALGGFKGLIVIDEIQALPSLFSVIRHLVDRDPQKKFLILGSSSPQLIQSTSESLAGRIGFIEMHGFSTNEIQDIRNLWMRGGFPKSYLASTNEISHIWREEYIRTFLERDIPNLGIKIPPRTMRQFWQMIAHYHAQIVNFSEIGKSFGINDMTVRRYLDILNGTFMIRYLEPWFVNVSKRVVKSPKLILRDSGIYHTLIGIKNFEELEINPKMGASWEGFVLEEIIRFLNHQKIQPYFYRTHGGTELDLYFSTGNVRIGIEIKFNEAPRVTKSMREAIKDLILTKLYIFNPGNDRYSIEDNIEVLGVKDLKKILETVNF